MTSTVFAIVCACVAVAAYLGYTLGRSDTEHVYTEAAREERQRERENSRRFADIARQTKSI